MFNNDTWWFRLYSIHRMCLEEHTLDSCRDNQGFLIPLWMKSKKILLDHNAPNKYINIKKIDDWAQTLCKWYQMSMCSQQELDYESKLFNIFKWSQKGTAASCCLHTNDKRAFFCGWAGFSQISIKSDPHLIRCYSISTWHQ